MQEEGVTDLLYENICGYAVGLLLVQKTFRLFVHIKTDIKIRYSCSHITVRGYLCANSPMTFKHSCLGKMSIQGLPFAFDSFIIIGERLRTLNLVFQALLSYHPM